jgi:Mg2+-importing ATPase
MKSEIKKNFSPYTTKKIEAIAAQFNVSLETGLSDQEVKKRQALYGLNEITTKEKTWFDILLRQFKSPFIYLLLAVLVIAFLLGSYCDSLVIFVVVLLNTLVGFYQEYNAAKTLKFLRQYIVSLVHVLRDGKEVEVLSKDLVPGDIVILYPGDIIPADIRLISDQNVMVDESILTGESLPVKKESEPTAQEATEVFKANNIGFWGTTIISGKAKGIIIATGLQTTMGNISQLTIQTERISSFSKQIAQFSLFILRLIFISLIIAFAAQFIVKGSKVNIIELILFASALAVSIIPEALPIITTFALSQGARRLAKKKTIVKRLSAIEDLGNIQVLCTDKTGTLTENVSRVESVFGNNEREIVFYASMVVSFEKENLRKMKGFNAALFEYLTPEEHTKLDDYKVVAEIPFDPQRRRNVVLVHHDDMYELIDRGSAEEIISRCVGIDESTKKIIEDWIKSEGLKGRRVLGVAKKEVDVKEIKTFDINKEEHDFIFLGLIAFGDPLKKTAINAINKAKLLKIQIKIISGDAQEVCGAVAYQVGLIKDPSDVMLGEEFAKKSDREKLEIVKNYNVFARVSPQQKYEIITYLQQEKEVGYVGDGINDAPALKIANVALAVQDAAGIACEAADIILLKKSLMVIVDGIEEGRKVFANTLKYIRYTLSVSFGNFYAIAFASLFLDYLPILPAQILLVNLLSDMPMISIATDNANPEELKRPARYDIRGILALATILGLVSNIFDFIFFGLFVQTSPKVLQTSWFVENILTAIAFLFSIRTSRVFFKTVRPSWTLLILSGISILIALCLPFTSIGQYFFSFTPVKLEYILWIFGITIAYFITTEIVKVLYYQYFGTNHTNDIHHAH